ncbi:MAG: leucine-rich repeat protein [Verrucomicrobiota bacterium]
MKTLTFYRANTLLPLLTAALLVCQSAPAAPQYATGSITWDNASTAAWSAASGGPYTSPWSSGNDAVFEGVAGTLTITAATAHNLTFLTTGYILSGTGTLTLSGTTPTISLGSGISATIGNGIAGSAGLTKAGAGALSLTGTNSYTGMTTVSEGLLFLGGSNGSISAPITIYQGGSLTLDNTTSNKANRLGNGYAFTSNGGTFNYNVNAISGSYAESIGALTLNPGALTINTTQAATGQTSALTLASITRTPGGTVFFSGAGLGADARNKVTFTTPPTLVDGIIPGALIYNGSTYDLATLSGNDLSKYSGYTTGAGTTWTADTINARPVAASTTSSDGILNSLVLDNGKNVVPGLSALRNLTLGNGTAPGLVVQTGGSSSIGTTSTRVILQFGVREAIFHVASGGNLTINGQNANVIMVGSGGTTKTGLGTLTLGSDSSAGGVFTQGGMTGSLNLNEGLYEVFCASNNGLAFNDSGIFFNGGNLRINVNGAGINFNKTSPNTPLIVNADGMFTMDNRSTASAFAGVTHTFGTLTVNNSPNFTLAAGTYVTSGTQQLTVGATTLNSDATFTLNNSAAAAMQLSVGAIIDHGNTITLKGNGKLIQTGAWSGTGGLTLDPTFTGTATLNQANTFNGATTVNGGTLKLSTGTALAATTSVSISAGATLDLTVPTASGTYSWPASLSASGAAMAATIAGTPGGTLSMGSKPITLTYDASSPSLTVTGATLSLGGNAFTIVVPDAALDTGTYTLVSASSAISGTVNRTPLYTGGFGVVPGATGVVSISGNNVILTVTSGAAIYTVTYSGNGNTGGAVPTDVNGPYENDALVTILTNSGGLVKTGFTFAGWNTAADGTGTSYAAANTETLTMGSTNVILYAKWIPIITYAVTYYGNGNTSGTVPVDGGTYLTDATVTVKANTGTLTKTGFAFAGWNTAANGSGTPYAASGSATFTMGTANVTLFAQWAIPYSVSYDGNTSTGGSVPTDSIAYASGATVIVKTNTGTLTKTGFAFAGWNTAANGSGTPYAASGSATFTIGSANVTLFAQWAVPHSVTYDSNASSSGSVPVDSATYATGTSVIVKANTGALTKTGFTFTGWNTAADGSGTSYAASGSAILTMGTANVILFAKWEVTYTVTYNSNGSTSGTVPTDAGTYAAGTLVTLRANTGSLTKTGFTFTGWNTAANGSGTSYASSGSATLTMGSASVILYAKWDVTYSVTYDSNGSTSGIVPTDNGTDATGATVNVSANTGGLTKTGFTFTGWNTAMNGSGTSYATSGSATFTMASANVTLYAQWGEASIYTYTINSSQISITGYTGAGGAVSIPGTINGMPVTSIGDYAFYKAATLTSITIPNGVTSIGSRAFFNCANLTAITLPASVTSIGNWAFQSCTGLTGISIPNGITSIGESTFESCTKLASVTMSSSLTSIGDWAFYNCSGLTVVAIPGSVTSIGNWAFKACTKLTSINIPSGVTHIADGVFEACSALSGVTIPSNATRIGNSAFYSCTSLSGISIPNGVSSIGTWAFASCTKLISVTIPASVTSIGDRAFDSCALLTTASIPGSVTNIGSGAFDSCPVLTGVSIPGSVSNIGDWTFYSCAKLTGASIPNGVTSIGSGAFESCTGLTGVTIPASVTSIGDWAFKSCNKLTGVAIPNGVTSIGDWTFASCSGLTSVMIPASVTSIGNGAFSSCSNLTGVTIPDGVTSIGDWVFYFCSKLTGVAIPDGVTSIGEGAFQSCGLLTGLTIPDGVTYIGDRAFDSCTGLTSLFFNGDAPSLGGSAVFYGDSVTVYYLPSTTGWGATIGGRQCVSWNPQAQNTGVLGNKFGFTIRGSAGLVIVVEACTDLANPVWVPLATKTLTGGSADFSDPASPGYPRRFYRFRPQQ